MKGQHKALETDSSEQGMLKIEALLKASRVQSSFVTVLLASIGYLVVEPVGFSNIVGLLLVFIPLHIYGSLLNELCDIEYDRKYGRSDSHPVADGHISPGSVAVGVPAVGSLSWASAASATSTYTGMFIFGAMFLAITAYNIWSKSKWWAGVCFATGSGIAVLFGGAVAGNITQACIVLSAFIGLHSFNMVIEGDLKDINSPEASVLDVLGVKLSMSNRIGETSVADIADDLDSGEIETINYPLNAYVVVFGLKLVEFLSLVLLFAILADVLNVVEVFVAFVTGCLMAYSGWTYFGILRDEFNGRDISTTISKHEITSVTMLMVVLTITGGAMPVLMVVASVAWYLVWNKAMYHDSLTPTE